MANLNHASAQFAHLGHTDPAAAQQLWATALQHLPPRGLRALAEAMPPTGAVAQSLRDQLSSLAMERATSPQKTA
jgi:hypothetical protein